MGVRHEDGALSGDRMDVARARTWGPRRPRTPLAVTWRTARMQGCQHDKHKLNEYRLLTHIPLDIMAAIVADHNVKCIFLNENNKIPIRISLKFVLRSPINNKLALV